MSIKFTCASCGHRLKAYPEQAGKPCKCTRCGNTMTVPAPTALPVPAAPPTATPAGGWKRRLRRAFAAMVALAVVAGGVALAVFLYDRTHEVDRKLNDLA